MADTAKPIADRLPVLQPVYGHVALAHCGSEGEDASRWPRKTLRPRDEFSAAGGLSDGIGSAPGAERLRIGGYGHGFHRGLDLVPRFRAFVCRHSASDR